VVPKLVNGINGTGLGIPQQINKNELLERATIQIADKIETSMNYVMLGSITVNFLISISLKQVIKAIRVLQFIAFFVLIEVSYPPGFLIFMQSLFRFTTFKIVPEKIFGQILVAIGVKDKQDKNNGVVIEIENDSTGRRLEELESSNL
jgi:hypothetical protein